MAKDGYKTYITKHSGTISLVIDGIILISKSYRNVSQRQALMTRWKNMFQNINSYGRIYIHVSHEDLIRRPETDKVF